MICPDNDIGVENVEVQVDSSNIHFLISIKIDSTALPKYVQPL